MVNILADQAYNAFSAFEPTAVTRIDPDTICKNRGKPQKNASLDTSQCKEVCWQSPNEALAVPSRMIT